MTIGVNHTFLYFKAKLINRGDVNFNLEKYKKDLEIFWMSSNIWNKIDPKTVTLKT